MNDLYFSTSLVADILSVSKSNVLTWINNKKIKASLDDKKEYIIHIDDLLKFKEFKNIKKSNWEFENNTKPLKPFSLIELFAGAGGLAIGMERAGFQTIMFNEIDKHACNTLRKNRPTWNIVEKDIREVNFSYYHHKIDVLTGGFPCQSFSYAGKSLGFEDVRGTLFFEFARALKEIKPKVFLAENVKGLKSHDDGKTFQTIQKIINNIGYTLVESSIYKSIFYKVPQKRERLILIGVRNDLANKAVYNKPSPYRRVMTFKDIMIAGDLYPTKIPESPGQTYPQRKKEILEHVPEGGFWKDLPIDLQKEYMKGSFFLGGGKTGMARRLALSEPSLTLTTSPAQKQTERCHPLETRPLTIREYARIQTFPDEWEFCGSLSSIYKQIGNAVPVNMAEAIAKAIIRMLNKIES
ncbi:DNA cytosine methyltransferase [Zymomonas mobilis]|uniref:DNA cytosine methyltransferase n=1 Tax=Zymomonas mobilis TaxID=542 RepID=UPI0039E7CCCC